MTNEEETAYIHGLLNLMKDRPQGYYIADEGAAELGFNDINSFDLIRRLQSEGLATENYATNMLLTPLGRQIARGPGGYQGHLLRQAQEQQRKDSRESRSALGSFLSGWAGVAGLLIAAYTLWDSHQNSSELDTLRKQVRRLEQAHARDSVHVMASPATVHQNQASTPNTPATSSSPAPMPAHTPPR
jgi:hypothetical protein